MAFPFTIEGTLPVHWPAAEADATAAAALDAVERAVRSEGASDTTRTPGRLAFRFPPARGLLLSAGPLQFVDRGAVEARRDGPTLAVAYRLTCVSAPVAMGGVLALAFGLGPAGAGVPARAAAVALATLGVLGANYALAAERARRFLRRALAPPPNGTLQPTGAAGA